MRQGWQKLLAPRISAGTLVSVGATLMLAGLMYLGFVSNTGFGMVLVVVGVVCLGAGYFEWRRREDRASLDAEREQREKDLHAKVGEIGATVERIAALPETSEPDVLLELPEQKIAKEKLAMTAGWTMLVDKPVPLVFYNVGDTAMHIRIEPVDSGPYPIGYYSGDAVRPAGTTYGHCKLTFGPIPHIAAGERRPCTATVIEPDIIGAMMRAGGPPLGLPWLLECALKNREHTGLQRLAAGAGGAEMQATKDANARTPISIGLRVTYKNRTETIRWARIETLEYDSVDRSLTVKHGERIDITDEPDISVRFEFPNRFWFRNYGGNAKDVTINGLSIPAYVRDGAIVAEDAVQFPVVDVDAGELKQVFPTYTYMGIPLPGRTMDGFFKAFIDKRQLEAFPGNGEEPNFALLGSAAIALGQPPPHVGSQDTPKALKGDLADPNTKAETAPADPEQEGRRAYYDAKLKFRSLPVDIDLHLLYSSRASGTKWERIDSLHYEPTTASTRINEGVLSKISS